LAALTPAPKRAIEGWLAELSVIVARRPDDEFAEELRVEAYASRLSRYPADVARHVLLGKTWRFFPTWDELERECEARTAGRKLAIRVLESGGSDPEPERHRVTADRAAAIMAEVGFRPRRMEAAE
ncbi:MAG: hypothetical protein VKL39_24290, partial [Leptolyngbyaceae bacterium]|nr:hypothetical protein [Leptolyngbyaceae bacterium]